MTDYSNARYWAISGIGYGKGHTAEEARDNYVEVQLCNWAAKNTVYKTRPKFKAALIDGDASASLYYAPEGFTGFVTGMGAKWTRKLDDGSTEHREFSIHDRVFTLGGAYKAEVRVVVNDDESTVTLRADGEDAIDALRNAEKAVSAAIPYASVFGVSAKEDR